MKNLRAFAALLAAGLVLTGVPAQAASKGYTVQVNGKNCYVKVLTNWDWCRPGNGIPGVEIPDAGETETPDAETPDMELPDAETPDAPENNVPETEDSVTDNSYAAQVVRLVNEERAKAGLSALTVDSGLEAAGLVRAREIVTSFSHTRPDGSSFATAIREQGVSYRGAGENIAWGQKSPEAVVEAWMNSEGHRANILNKNFTRIGVGHYQNANGTNYWVQLFAY